MNQRVKSPLPAITRRAWLCLPLLLPALAIEVAQSTAPPARGNEGAWRFATSEATGPYLPFVGAPPLRFQETAPPPEESVRPPAGASSLPGGKAKTEIVRQPVTVPPAANLHLAAVPTAKREENQISPEVSAGPPGPPPILPDDAERKVRPEDFLPFFQFPGSPPVSGRPPPSTATYNEQ